MNKDEYMKFWLMLLYPGIFNYLMYFSSELTSKDLNDYKNSKAIINQVGCKHCCNITLQVIVSAS